MKILFIAPEFYPHIGGVEKHIYELSLELLRDGHRVTVLVEKHDKSSERHEVIDGIEVRRTSRINVKFLRRLSRYRNLVSNLGLMMKFDIVHFHDFHTMWDYGWLGYALLKAMRRKFYITFHGWEGVFPPNRKVVERRRTCERRAEGNICVGHYLCKWYGTNASIVSYGGVRRYTGTTSTDAYIVYVGRLAEDTGIFDYLKAWEIVGHSMSGMKFIVCGDGLLKTELEEYVGSRSLKNVEFTGFITRPDEYVKNARLVLTSGYLSILEAFSMRKPVVATFDNQLKRDYLEMMPGSAELLWVAQGSAEIARYIAEAMSDDEKVGKAYEFSLRNSWTKVKNDYYTLWKQHDHGP